MQNLTISILNCVPVPTLIHSDKFHDSDSESSSESLTNLPIGSKEFGASELIPRPATGN